MMPLLENPAKIIKSNFEDFAKGVENNFEWTAGFYI